MIVVDPVTVLPTAVPVIVVEIWVAVIGALYETVKLPLTLSPVYVDWPDPNVPPLEEVNKINDLQEPLPLEGVTVTLVCPPELIVAGAWIAIDWGIIGVESPPGGADAGGVLLLLDSDGGGDPPPDDD